tara:strand:+ start:292 stop:1092 length:801 start_codon:yes stop_codon:yes gene_type:complete
MINWTKKSIYFLENMKDKWLFIVIFFIFGTLFINLFEPFNLYTWTKFKETPKILISLFHMLPFCAGIIFTQFFIRRIFLNFYFTILRLGFWIIFEVILVSLVNILIFGFSDLLFTSMLFDSFYRTSLVMFLCYFISFTLLLSILKKDFYIKKNKSLIPLRDYKNKVKITLDFNLILYVKSTENYVQTFYFQNNKLKNILIRNTIKTIETELKPYGIMRSQRSFLVNKSQILSIEKINNKQVINLYSTDIKIPLSTSFKDNFLDVLS